MPEGTIACIRARYVILNDRRHVAASPILCRLLPGDIVSYEVILSHLHITGILSRTPTLLFCVVRKIEHETAFLYAHRLPKTFCPTLPDDSYTIGTVILLSTHTDLSLTVERVYGNIRSREQDRDLFLSLYLLTASTITPHYRPLVVEKSEETVDLCHLPTFTVDPTQSRDFDDAISVVGNRIYVHIVDARQIEKGSQEDVNALRLAFTLYLPYHVEHILPRHRAENELSLIEGEPRHVITLELELDDAFAITSSRFYPSLVIVKRRYDYHTFLSDLGQFPVLTGFTARYQRPSLAIPTVCYSFQEEITATVEDHSDLSHKIIETVMVMTNLAISEHISTIPQRYHARSGSLSGRLLSDGIFSGGASGNPVIDSILIVRQYRMALYEAEKTGHHGLDVKRYTHFTSPIRRYFDVVVHRILAGVEYDNLEEILDYINRRERYVDSLTDLAGSLAMMTIVDQSPDKKWTGYVIRHVENGMMVLLSDFLEEIFVERTRSLYERVEIKLSVRWETIEIRGQLV